MRCAYSVEALVSLTSNASNQGLHIERNLIQNMGNEYLFFQLLTCRINPLTHEALPGHRKICHLIHIVLDRKNEYMIYFY